LATTKSIASTEAQNNFGQVLDEVNQRRTRYIIERRGVPQAMILSLDDLEATLTDEKERERMMRLLIKVLPSYPLGRVLDCGGR
jgi:prevent-host-death family protein